ncbi:alpha/beta hydrolase [Natronolimnobius sp. AArcel1]|uniref:alpha/beta fold hydrolase n=1 Tax=Natronolimnobius sp. AArcel1 TaxID=1679093 RepID=UPI0013ED7D26|nr:alpha/beta hydrolase [Natronolimnobius sp. AArcel1]NGM68579.1 alpha/beta hydrolase [Natronolimnobius sp. AArcel1]
MDRTDTHADSIPDSSSESDDDPREANVSAPGLGIDRDTHTLADGRQLAYATFGPDDGTPLIFHHGTPGSGVLGAVLSYAARGQGVHLIAPTRPGYGRSDPYPAGTLETWAEDCEELADALGLETFAVAGFSGGGPYALAVADALPERVTAAGIVSPPVPESAGVFGRLARFPRLLGLAFRAGNALARYRGDQFVVDRLTERSLHKITIEIVGQDFRTALENGPAGAVRESRLLAGDWSLSDPGPAVETTVWHGAGDTNVALEAVQDAYAEREHTTVHTVENDHLGTLISVRKDIVAIAE